MPYYLAQVKYADGSVEKMIRNPQDRAKLMGEALAKQGIRLECFFYSFGGDFDSFAIYEVPEGSNVTLFGAALAAFATGAYENTKRTPLLTTEEATRAMKVAAKLSGVYPAPIT